MHVSTRGGGVSAGLHCCCAHPHPHRHINTNLEPPRPVLETRNQAIAWGPRRRAEGGGGGGWSARADPPTHPDVFAPRPKGVGGWHEARGWGVLQIKESPRKSTPACHQTRCTAPLHPQQWVGTVGFVEGLTQPQPEGESWGRERTAKHRQQQTEPANARTTNGADAVAVVRQEDDGGAAPRPYLAFCGARMKVVERQPKLLTPLHLIHQCLPAFLQQIAVRGATVHEVSAVWDHLRGSSGSQSTRITLGIVAHRNRVHPAFCNGTMRRCQRRGRGPEMHLWVEGEQLRSGWGRRKTG